MKRYNIELTDKAETVYKGVPLFERSRYVSDAIIEKHTRETSTEPFTEAQQAWLRQEIARLIGEGKK